MTTLQRSVLESMSASTFFVVFGPCEGGFAPTSPRHSSLGHNLFLDDCAEVLNQTEKGGKDQRLASSYRPIALLPTIGKVLKKLMTQRLTYHLESTNILNDR
ncbi:hypothetical protein AVEN_186392-1 [Araneus ventricosus]|uniref:Reverse transcriptase domain-containing protein n=1 Tax=Araneus ventricosus TaxID=182803 RepID=A0A4Y2CZY4_ARAVE|nr:hypothetical protein AVEN_186392-1 [Araneus ventricosus]